MRVGRGGSWRAIRRTLGVLAVSALCAGVVSLTAMAPPTAMGALTGEFASFGECPYKLLSNLYGCVYVTVTHGEVRIGATAIPVTGSIVLQGGVVEETDAIQATAGANVMTSTPQVVPGGLFGLISPQSLSTPVRSSFEQAQAHGLTGVTASVELVGTAILNANNIYREVSPGVVLPVRMHLSNPLLGGSCYIGSAANPMTLNLTVGATSPPPPYKPITGALGPGEWRDNGNILVLYAYRLLDNTFAVPTAQGCGGASQAIIDRAIDEKLGMPSPPGHNTAILGGHLELAIVKEGIIEGE